MSLSSVTKSAVGVATLSNPLIGIPAYGAEGYAGKIKGAFDKLTGVDKTKKAAEMARELAALNVKAIGEETAETVRRKGKEFARTESLGTARAAASGLKTSGSIDEYLSEMASEHGKEIEWTKKSGKSKQEIAKAKGELEFERIRSQARQERAGYVQTGLSVAGLF